MWGEVWRKPGTAEGGVAVISAMSKTTLSPLSPGEISEHGVVLETPIQEVKQLGQGHTTCKRQS